MLVISTRKFVASAGPLIVIVNVVHSGKIFLDYVNTVKIKRKIVMTKRKIVSKKKCSKKCRSKCSNESKSICENKLAEKETVLFVKEEPGILSKIYRYFFPVR
jgi:hypothetical protein